MQTHLGLQDVEYKAITMPSTTFAKWSRTKAAMSD